ncbi:iron-containing alcohol dehydrogenase [Paenibacillus sp.]|uniref:iron-containing alcohol dehydrogenase n=1 Tax=Paenibacillus sp. TaxID=58172 RepID=UPI002D7619E9|nr:iron-containing alcohol dehydrogenase [Paenibacillus sp.]HZG87813.1 iron-containing alcohol dehydrogenase [Paenibacillus sp.]
MNSFQFAGTPNVRFGSGSIAQLPEALPAQARRVLFVMGGFQRTNAEAWARTEAALRARGVEYEIAYIRQEPDAPWVDAVADAYRGRGIDAVVAIGGGSALDAGKAAAAMLRTEPGDTVLHYLEGQPLYRPHSGDKAFFVAVPTTSGTGSEMTKNAVVSIPGGFKRSIRHDRFIPDAAIVDPLLTVSCPRGVKAASGLDALTQLIESYVSTKASPITDALAFSGIEAAAGSLVPICTDAENDVLLHERMAYASMVSGATLAHAGLGVVHGLAGPLGGRFGIPHGVICGTLLAEATRRIVDRLRAGDGGGDEIAVAKAKYARVGAALTGHPENDPEGCLVQLAATLAEWTERLAIPRLGTYGVTEANVDDVVAAADSKQSPVQFDKQELFELLKARM